MRKGFLQWLQDYAIYTGLVGLVEGMLAVVAFAGALSALFGATAIKAGAMFAVVFGVLGLIALLSFNRIEWRNRVDLHQALLAHYCVLISERFNHQWRTTSWKDVVVIESNGDAREIITVSAIVECDTLDFFTIYTGPGWNQPEKYRRKVKAKVRSLEVEGAGGTRRDVTSSWTDNGNLKILVHFGEPAVRDSEISMKVELDWPGKCVPLMRRHSADEFALRFLGPLGHLEYQILLPPGFDVYYDTIGLSQPKDHYSCVRETVPGGRVQVLLVATDVEENRRLGLRLDLKDKRYPP
jgi:hypothetical protein